jgi:hypothetical protein
MTTATTTPTTMTCICDTVHTFPAGVAVGECAGCGLGLVLTEEVAVESGSEADDDCAECHGGGIVRTWRLGPDSIDDHETCPTCHGTGNA